MEEIKKKRLKAMAIDFLIMCLIAWGVEIIISLITEPIFSFGIYSSIAAIHLSLYWIICKDCYKGMSPGKYIMGIQIINLKTNCIAGPLRCIVRNLCYFISFIEFIIFFASPQGLRIGDYLTSTRVTQKIPNQQQKLKPVIFTFIGIFALWIIEIILIYMKLKERTLS